MSESIASHTDIPLAGERYRIADLQRFAVGPAHATACMFASSGCDVTVVDIDDHSVRVEAKDGSAEQVPARTAIWAAGVTASELAGTLARLSGAETDRAGRVTVEARISRKGQPLPAANAGAEQ